MGKQSIEYKMYMYTPSDKEKQAFHFKSYPYFNQ